MFPRRSRFADEVRHSPTRLEMLAPARRFCDEVRDSATSWLLGLVVGWFRGCCGCSGCGSKMLLPILGMRLRMLGMRLEIPAGRWTFADGVEMFRRASRFADEVRHSGTRRYISGRGFPPSNRRIFGRSWRMRRRILRMLLATAGRPVEMFRRASRFWHELQSGRGAQAWSASSAAAVFRGAAGCWTCAGFGVTAASAALWRIGAFHARTRS